MGGEGDDLDALLEEIAFLARSPYRVRVLEALASRPFDRHALQEATDVPRVTLGRVLDALQERGWIRQRGKEYTISPVGTLVVEAFEPLVASVRTARKLRPIVEWFPTRELDFDLVHLADATITVPSRNNPLLPVRRGIERLQSADEVRLLSSVVVPEALEANRLATIQASQRFEAVFTTGAVETILDDPEMARRFAELLAAGRADVYRFDGDVPCVVAVLDGVVGRGLEDDQGLPRALIETEDPSVRDWADSIITDYRRRSESVDADAFTDRSTSG
jgi:predicted transcriptional regulator